MDSITIGVVWVLLSAGAIAMATLRRSPGVPVSAEAPDRSGERRERETREAPSVAFTFAAMIYGALLLGGFAYLAWVQARQFLNH